MKQKALADEKTIEALTEKQKADSARDAAYRLRMIALSENLAYQSAQITSNPELAGLLAIESYLVAQANGGDVDSPSLYAAARKAVRNLDESYSPVKASLPAQASALKAIGKGAGVISKEGTYYELEGGDAYTVSKTISQLPSGEELSAGFIINEEGNFVLGLKSNNIFSTEQGRLEGHSALLRGSAISANGKRLITGDRDGIVKVWDNGTEAHTTDVGARVRDIVRVGNSDQFLIALENGMVMKFSLTDFTVATYAQKEGVRAEAVSTTSFGNKVAIGYSDGVVEVYSESGSRLAELPHIGSIRFLRLNAEADLLMVGTSAKSVFMYKLSNLSALPTEISDNRSIDGLDYSADKESIIYITSDRELKELPVRNSAWIDQLKKLVSRELTVEERKILIGEN